eukprot:SAG22_NODE_355_length_11775_cov_76.400651_10_plen_152_part_00
MLLLSFYLRQCLSLWIVCNPAQIVAAGLVGFVADGAVLPRLAGDSDLPMAASAATPFVSPPSLQRQFVLPNRGAVRARRPPPPPPKKKKKNRPLFPPVSPLSNCCGTAGVAHTHTHTHTHTRTRTHTHAHTLHACVPLRIGRLSGWPCRAG